MKKNGTEFIIQNHFKELDYDTFEDFVCNSVYSCFNKARRMRRLLIEKATNQNQNQQIKKLEDIKNKNQITIKRPEDGKNKNVKLIFTKKQSSSSSSDDLTHNNNKADISDKMPDDQSDIKNEKSNVDQSDCDEKMKKERKQINDDAKEKCAHIVDDDDNNNEYEEDDDVNYAKDEDEEYDENDVEDGNEDEDYDNSEIKTVCNKDINTNTDKTHEECDDDDDVDTNNASENDFD